MRDKCAVWVMRFIIGWCAIEIISSVMNKNLAGLTGFTSALVAWVLVQIKKDTTDDLIAIMNSQSKLMARMMLRIKELEEKNKEAKEEEQ